MQVVNKSKIVSYQDWTLRVYVPEKPERLLVLIHGYKGDENSMWIFTHGLKPEYCIMAPRAPFQVSDGGFSWRPEEGETMAQMSPGRLHLGLTKLVEMIKGYAISKKLVGGPFDMIGFSQGAAMVYLLAFSYPGLFRKAALLGGFPPVTGADPVNPTPLAGKLFFVAHGSRDDKVPVEQSKLMVNLLDKAGAKVTYCEDDVGHKVSSRCLRALNGFLAD